MIRRQFITKEALKSLYPTTVQGYSTNFTCRDVSFLHHGEDHLIVDRENYKVTKTLLNDALVFRESKIGFYELEDLRNIHGYRFVLLPEDKLTIIEEEGIVEKILPVLNKMMLGRFFLTPGLQANETILYLHYPEITISNSIGETHVMKDMVVGLSLIEHGIVESIKGKRFSFTGRELAIGYSHSHLHTSQAIKETFDTFCIGDYSPLRTYLRTLTHKCTADQFELLLVQLEEFLKWESIEGKPYISISQLFINQSNGTVAKLHPSQIDYLAKKFLEELTPDLLTKYNAYLYIVDPGAFKSKEIFDLEMSVTRKALESNKLADRELYSYDLESYSYLQEYANSSSMLPAQLNSTVTREIRGAFNIIPKTYENSVSQKSTTTIRRLGSQDLDKLYWTINDLLRLSHKNGENYIATESENTDNREVTVTDNNTTQPVSTEERVVGAIAL